MSPTERPPGFVVVANADAGSAERTTIRGVAGRLAETAPTSLAWTDGEPSFDAAVREAGDRRLVIAGGDGSLHLALNRLAALGHLADPVGIIPAGTGNDFARGIGLGTDALAAVDVVVDGIPRWYATIETSDGQLAHNNAHFGLGLVAAERGTAWKARLGRFAYSAAAVVEGIRYAGEAVTIEIDGRVVFDGPTLAVLVLLGPSMGGGVELIEGVDIDEPRLDVVALEVPAGAARLSMALDALRDRLAERDNVGRWTAEEVRVRTDGRLRGDVDGEMREWDEAVELRVRPRTWRVMSPAG